MINLRCALLSLLLLVLSESTLLAAERVTLEGPLMAGSLIVGKTAPGNSVTFEDKPLRVADDGTFLLGLGRDARPDQSIQIRGKDGFTYTHDFKLKKRTYKITRIDGLPKRKVTPDPEGLKRIRQDNAQIAQVRKLDTDLRGFRDGFQWPLTGRISGVYGSQRILNGKPRSPHNGVDIAAPTGTAIVAPASGRVALVHPDMFLAGQTVMIDHGHGLSSVYIHMSKITVKQGDTVRQGQKIGEVGMSGRATGPHLHWGVSLFRTHLDPMLLVAGKTGLTEAK